MQHKLISDFQHKAQEKQLDSTRESSKENGLFLMGVSNDPIYFTFLTLLHFLFC